MGDLLFRLLVLALAATMLGAQIFGLSHYPDQTVTGNMRVESVYLILMSSSLLLQSAVWALCLYRKRALDAEACAWGAATLTVMLVAWIGLTSILTTDVHYVFTGIFVAAFLTLVLIFCYLVWQPTPSLILRLCLVLELVCIVAMLILFNSKDFYLPEQIGFLAYTVVFTLFFWTHPYSEWAEQRPGEWERSESALLLLPHHYPGACAHWQQGP